MPRTRCGAAGYRAVGSSRDNPWVFLQTVSRRNCGMCWRDPLSPERGRLVQARREAGRRPGGFRNLPAIAAELCCVFQYGIHVSEALPIYSAAGECGRRPTQAPAIWAFPSSAWGCSTAGYFRRLSTKDGAHRRSSRTTTPEAADHAFAPSERRMVAVGDRLAGLLGLAARLAGQVGRVKLYLLTAMTQRITPRIEALPVSYTAAARSCASNRSYLARDRRMAAARGARIQPEVCHLNEGMRPLRCWNAPAVHGMNGQPFEVALAVTRRGPLHHAYGSGRRLRYVSSGAYRAILVDTPSRARITRHDLLALGRQNPNDASEPFKHGLSGNPRQWPRVNGVSRLHGKVTRHLFSRSFRTGHRKRSAGRTRDHGVHIRPGFGTGR